MNSLGRGLISDFQVVVVTVVTFTYKENQLFFLFYVGNLPLLMLGNFEHQGQQFHKKFALLTPALKNWLRARVSNQLKGPKPVQKEDRRSSIVFDHPMINPREIRMTLIWLDIKVIMYLFMMSYNNQLESDNAVCCMFCTYGNQLCMLELINYRLKWKNF